MLAALLSRDALSVPSMNPLELAPRSAALGSCLWSLRAHKPHPLSPVHVP